MKSSNLEKKIDEWLKQKVRSEPLSLDRDELIKQECGTVTFKENTDGN
jgi:hypothetical protein